MIALGYLLATSWALGFLLLYAALLRDMIADKDLLGTALVILIGSPGFILLGGLPWAVILR